VRAGGVEAAERTGAMLHLTTTVGQVAARGLYLSEGFGEVDRGVEHGLDMIFCEGPP